MSEARFELLLKNQTYLCDIIPQVILLSYRGDTQICLFNISKDVIQLSLSFLVKSCIFGIKDLDNQNRFFCIHGQYNKVSKKQNFFLVMKVLRWGFPYYMIKKRPKSQKLRFQPFLVLIFSYLKYTEGGNFDEKISKSHYTYRIFYLVHDNKYFANRPSE